MDPSSNSGSNINQGIVKVRATAPSKYRNNTDLTKEKAKLIAADVIKAKGSRNSKYNNPEFTLQSIAERHGVSLGLVKDMSCGRTWTDLTNFDNSKNCNSSSSSSSSTSDVDSNNSATESDDEKSSEGRTQVCCCCKNVKKLDEFGWKNKSQGVRKSTCKVCIFHQNKRYRKQKTARSDRHAAELILRPGDVMKECSECRVSKPSQTGFRKYSRVCKACIRKKEAEKKKQNADADDDATITS